MFIVKVVHYSWPGCH